MNMLFATPLPRQHTHHHLIFGYRNNVLVGKTSGDGTITLPASYARKHKHRP